MGESDDGGDGHDNIERTKGKSWVGMADKNKISCNGKIMTDGIIFLTNALLKHR